MFVSKVNILTTAPNVHTLSLKAFLTTKDYGRRLIVKQQMDSNCGIHYLHMDSLMNYGLFGQRNNSVFVFFCFFLLIKNGSWEVII